MRHQLIQTLLLAIIPSVLSAQAYQDTIFTFDPDTIVCKVDHMDDNYVYYLLFEYDSNEQPSTIDRDQVAHIVKDDETYYDLSKMNQDSGPAKESVKYSEGEGVIYQSYLDSPPVFQGGEVDIIRYLQNNVRNEANHTSIYGNSFIKILYEATITADGEIVNVNIAESSISTGNVNDDGPSIQDQIKASVSSMPNWQPAIYNNENIQTDIYIPVKFRIESYAIIMYSAKGAFVFNSME